MRLIVKTGNALLIIGNVQTISNVFRPVMSVMVGNKLQSMVQGTKATKAHFLPKKYYTVQPAGIPGVLNGS